MRFLSRLTPAVAALLMSLGVVSPASACSEFGEMLQATLDRLVPACPSAACAEAFPAPAFAPVAPAAGDAACRKPGLGALLRAMAETLKADGFVLLGEIHDNSAHHALRAGLVAHLAAAKPSAAKPAVGAAVVFEQFSADQQSGLEAFAAMPAPRTAADLMGKLAWDKSPWSKMADYAPLFDAAVASGAAIHAGDPGRAAMRQSAREGAGGLSPDEQVRLGLATPLDPALDAASLAEIEGAHCGLLPKSAFPGMAFAQRYRDTSLARALISAARGGGAILIAGNGHVRRDRGVPWYLDRLATGRPVLVVTFGEAEAGRADAAYAAPRAPSGQAAADWVVLAPKAERNSDPCEDMRAAFKSMKAPAQGPGNAAPAAPAPSSAPAQ